MWLARRGKYGNDATNFLHERDIDLDGQGARREMVFGCRILLRSWSQHSSKGGLRFASFVREVWGVKVI